VSRGTLGLGVRPYARSRETEFGHLPLKKTRKPGLHGPQVSWFEGGWADYEAYQRQKTGGQLQPHRVKFRRLATV
jgi:hypothetical protein